MHDAHQLCTLQAAALRAAYKAIAFGCLAQGVLLLTVRSGYVAAIEIALLIAPEVASRAASESAMGCV